MKEEGVIPETTPYPREDGHTAGHVTFVNGRSGYSNTAFTALAQVTGIDVLNSHSDLSWCVGLRGRTKGLSSTRRPQQQPEKSKAVVDGDGGKKGHQIWAPSPELIFI